MLDHRIVYSGQSIARPLRPSPSGASLLSAAKLAGANSKSNGSPGGPHAGKVASHQTGTATEHAPADSPAGKMVAAGRHRLLQLPRVPTNGPTLTAFLCHVINLWCRTLRKRSQKDWTTWERTRRLADDWVPNPRILDPWLGREVTRVPAAIVAGERSK